MLGLYHCTPYLVHTDGSEGGEEGVGPLPLSNGCMSNGCPDNYLLELKGI